MHVARNVLRAMRQNWKQAFNGSWRARNIKVIAYELARQRMQAEGPKSSLTSRPQSAQLESLVCGAVDWQTDWLPYWAARFGMQPALHRKIWEFAFISQVLSEQGKLRLGSSGIGFGCGKEPLPSVFAMEGCQILATDLPASDPRATAWAGGEQYGGSFRDVWIPALCPEDVAKERIRYRPVDMNSIPADTHGQFDFCWSACALEHLGSIARGLRFIVESTRCLKPGGVAVHTTELSLDPDRVLDNYPTVLFRIKDFERLKTDLQKEGVELLPIRFRPELPFLDEYVDVPPYALSATAGSTLSMLHLRVLVASFVTTSIGLVARRL